MGAWGRCGRDSFFCSLQYKAIFHVWLLFYEQVVASEGALEVLPDLGAVMEEVLGHEVVGVAGNMSRKLRLCFREPCLLGTNQAT